LPEGSFDWVQMTRDLIAAGVTVRACGTVHGVDIDAAMVEATARKAQAKGWPTCA
jgi:hypothetical protein